MLWWKRSDVPGLHMSLKDSGEAVEGYTFTRDGSVAATFSGGGLLTMPLYEWTIRDGRLQILDGSIVRDEFTLLRRDARIITVRRKSGVVAQFAYTRSE
jgi:hypothetical protein